MTENVAVHAQNLDLTFQTLTRGHVAVHDGEIRMQEGHSEFAKREANTPVNQALSSWKELTAPRPVERTGSRATGV